VQPPHHGKHATLLAKKKLHFLFKYDMHALKGNYVDLAMHSTWTSLMISIWKMLNACLTIMLNFELTFALFFN
jgi:hypothetical protein